MVRFSPSKLLQGGISMSEKHPPLVLRCVVLVALIALGWPSQLTADEIVPTDASALSIDSYQLPKRGNQEVFEIEHLITVPDGAVIHVIERFTAKAIKAKKKRAILMLTPTTVTNLFYDIEIDGDLSYNTSHYMARHKFFVYAVSYEGFGESSIPPDGRDVTFETTLAQMGFLVELIRQARNVDKVNVLGGSFGAQLAVALGSVNGPIPHEHINKIALTSFTYREFSPFVQTYVFTPELKAFLESIPYLETTPETYGTVLSHTDPVFTAWGSTAFLGLYPTGPLLEAFYLPASPAQDGRVPALQFWGDEDIMNTMDDVTAFQNEYGAAAELVVLPGGAHSPLFEPGRDAVLEQIKSFFKQGDDDDDDDDE